MSGDYDMMDPGSVPEPKNKRRRYRYKGKALKGDTTYNRYEVGPKIRPWAMTDDEIDKCIEKYPALARLWDKTG